jgi:hypothetical protein
MCVQKIPPNPNKQNFEQALRDINENLNIRIKFGGQVKISIFDTENYELNAFDKCLIEIREKN